MENKTMPYVQIAKDGEFKDTIVCTTSIFLPWWERIANLFVSEIVVTHEVQVSEIVSRHKIKFNVRAITFRDKFRQWYWSKFKNKGMGLTPGGYINGPKNIPMRTQDYKNPSFFLQLFFYFIFTISFLTSAVLNILWSIIQVPIYFYEREKVTLKYMLFLMPEFLRVQFNAFDNFGLRHNSAYLNDNKTRAKVAAMRLTQQANFADEITCKNYPRKQKEVKDNPNAAMRLEYVTEEIQNMNISALTTTAIGNLAWVALYFGDSIVEDKAIEKLNEIREYYSEKQ